MAMSRKDYVLLAETLRSTVPDPVPAGASLPLAACRAAKYVQHRETTSAIIRALARDNPRFDGRRFLAAVYPEEV